MSVDVCNHDPVVKVDGSFPFKGRVTWLTPEQGGRPAGPPPPSSRWDCAHTAFVPPHSLSDGLASFVLRGLSPGAWTSSAEGRWLVVDNDGAQLVTPGTVVVVTEGHRVVAYFQVENVTEESRSE